MYSFCSLVHFSSLAQAKSKQTTVSRRETQCTGSEEATASCFRRDPAPGRSHGIKWPHLPHTLHPVLCSEAWEPDCQRHHQRLVFEELRDGNSYLHAQLDADLLRNLSFPATSTPQEMQMSRQWDYSLEIRQRIKVSFFEDQTIITV